MTGLRLVDDGITARRQRDYGSLMGERTPCDNMYLNKWLCSPVKEGTQEKVPLLALATEGTQEQ